MTAQDLLDKITAKFSVQSFKIDLEILNADVEKDIIPGLLAFLRDELNFDSMKFMTALDWPEENKIEVIYRLFSYKSKDSVVIRVKLDRTMPENLEAITKAQKRLSSK